MDKRYACYCGLCCGNCAVKAKVEPAAKILYAEMIDAGFEDIVHMIPGGSGFWPFLKGMVVDGACVSCREGSGNPGCRVRICAIERQKEMCAFCEDYPCGLFNEFFSGYPVIRADNDMLREEGWDVWLKTQDERRAKGFTYSDGRK
ncbi:MAG: DUF3795 domain-containing protein [Methanomassiliicoccaceae archaeon]|jgi:hypothetical protein|nr:DUF3795 domain-containing protein [Methanomassiliicoccaceae archaeon]